MQRLRIDFGMSRGHEMIIDKEHGIERAELDELELQMLRSGRIPYLLPIDWLEVDGAVTFRYALTGMKMLVHRLQQEPLTMEQYYSLLLSMSDALIECKEYMLRPEGCLLNEQFIFMGERFGDIRLAYLPLKSYEENGQRRSDELLSLAVRWTAFVESIDGDGLKRILQLLNHNGFSLTELRETLLELIAKESSNTLVNSSMHSSISSTDHISANRLVSPSVKGENSQLIPSTASATLVSHEYNESVGNQPSISMESEKYMKYAADDDHALAGLDAPEDEDEESNNRGKWIAGAIFTVASACIWRYVYLPLPTQTNLLVSAALTLLLLAGLIFVWRKDTALLMMKRDSIDDSELFEPHSGLLPASSSWRFHAKQEQSDDHFPGTTNSMGSYSVSLPSPVQAIQSEQIVESPSLFTGRKQKQMPTTVLGSSNHAHAGDELTVIIGEGARQAWLSRVWNGQEEKIALDSESFKIGRSSDGGVCYAESAEGVSRLHLEIESVDGIHHAKDLGSRNGSLLNGILMVPYKSYKLKSGDQIHLAGNKGPLYELMTG